jgi:hypothetical protein
VVLALNCQVFTWIAGMRFISNTLCEITTVWGADYEEPMRT